MPTVSQGAGLYLPRHQLIDNSLTGSYRHANGPSQVDISSDVPNTSFEQSNSVIKVINVNNLPEIPIKPKRRLWPIVLVIGLCALLIIAAILIPLLLKYLNNQNTSTSTSSTNTTTTTAISLPTFCNATCYITSRAALSSYTAVWTFENNLNDILNVYNGTGINSPSYSTGYVGQALSLTGTQYVTAPFINFAYSSFTIEAWIKPTTLANNGPNYAMFGECQISGVTRANCMRLFLRNNVTYNLFMGKGFWIDDLVSLTTVASGLAGTWIHLAFVYDYSLRQQTIYRNGYIDGQATLTGSTGAYVGTSGLVNIGAQQTTDLFNGLIDHMFVSNRAKTACEILDDATLVAYYSFDSGSVQDSGPNYITGTATTNVTTVTGHVNQAFAFGSSNAYFYFGGLTALGTGNQAFSFSLWVKPTANTGGGTILHVASGPNGYSNGGPAWCVPFMGIDSANRLIAQVWSGSAVSVIGPILPLNVWTHVVETYSTTNGVILYVNGTRIGTTGSTNYAASGVPDYVFVGYYGPSGGSCATGSVAAAPFSGAVDELRIYSRELSLPDVCVLANQ